MVHTRLNEREPNPNPHINFIVALPEHDSEDARHFLRALAAQVRPLMKAHGFSVNSFEEYEHNSVFAGRNWNSGETVELVLRRPNGSFLPASWLMSTFCHELAHIKHMNHGPAFQALWRQLRSEVRNLQDKGYYGDGYWSSGTRLADAARITGQGIEAGDFPEYICGGAQTRRRPTSPRRRVRTPRKNTTTASNKTGRQTAKKRKAGARVTSKSAFLGEGVSLDGDSGSNEGDKGKGKTKGGGFGKQAGSKRAREERALATERRLRALLQPAPGSSLSGTPASGSALDTEPLSQDPNTDDEDGDEEEGEGDTIPETDLDRRRALLASATQQNLDLQSLKSGSSWTKYEDDFNFVGAERNTQGRECDLPVASGSTLTGGQKRKRGLEDDEGKVPDAPTKLQKTNTPIPAVGASTSLGLGRLVQSEVDFRKKEALGMEPVKGGGRMLGGTNEASRRNPGPRGAPGAGLDATPQQARWACLVCTLENEAEHLACSACATPRGVETIN